MSDASTNGKPRVLVVDDNPGEVKALRIGLDLEGFSVTGVTGGKQALSQLSEETGSKSSGPQSPRVRSCTKHRRFHRR